ncbi:hypothetical protein GPECTOR_11g58 [Gonium pectorale]|uniref:Uncharacterized protein n=1 Tax=Gonium pectorale TaxID=33097 RepID=A0A150GQB1_GONPE|nr:hypothetical protein GPECTOR_11g58 [Gonium pectorale]|eukprot:KXZ51932.1 hypothetical protein GPECTOR_11g58 [Gonium pectorale]
MAPFAWQRTRRRSALLFLAYGAWAAACLAQAAAADASSRLASASNITAKAADLSACPTLRIAVINGVPYHYEVLAGLLHVLSPYAPHTDVYLNRYTRAPTADGAWELLRWSKAKFTTITRGLASVLAKRRPKYDLVILVSTDYELDALTELLKHLPRRLTIAYIHNSDYEHMPRLLEVTAGSSANRSSAVGSAAGDGGGGAGSEVQLVTLSPHAARSLAAASGQPVEWVLAAYPFQPQPDCLEATEVDLLGHCLKGFAMQGKFSSLRRNYSAIWDQLRAHQQELTRGDVGRLFHMNLLGKGDESRLGLPPELQPHVSLMRRLRFATFYNAIHRSFALIPALGSSKYYTDKFSSTILSSLIAGTPVVADARFLAAYRFFTPETVYVQGEGEQEVDVMLRLLRTRAPELLQVRRALRALQDRLNEQAAGFYAGKLRRLCGSASAYGGAAGGRVGGGRSGGGRSGGGSGAASGGGSGLER